MRGRGWDVGSVRAGVGLHLEKEVGLVFEYVDVVLLCYPVDLFSSLLGLRGTGGILARRYGVEQPRFGSTVVSGWIPTADD